MPAERDRILGELAVEQGLVARGDVDRYYSLIDGTPNAPPLAQLLIRDGRATAGDLIRLRELWQARQGGAPAVSAPAVSAPAKPGAGLAGLAAGWGGAAPPSGQHRLPPRAPPSWGTTGVSSRPQGLGGEPAPPPSPAPFPSAPAPYPAPTPPGDPLLTSARRPGTAGWGAPGGPAATGVAARPGTGAFGGPSAPPLVPVAPGGAPSVPVAPPLGGPPPQDPLLTSARRSANQGWAPQAPAPPVSTAPPTPGRDPFAPRPATGRAAFAPGPERGAGGGPSSAAPAPGVPTPSRAPLVRTPAGLAAGPGGGPPGAPAGVAAGPGGPPAGSPPPAGPPAATGNPAGAAGTALKKDEILLRVLVTRGALTLERAKEARAQSLSQGARLGPLLVRGGFVERPAVEAAIAYLREQVVVCTACGTPAERGRLAGSMTCPRCQGQLVGVLEAETIGGGAPAPPAPAAAPPPVTTPRPTLPDGFPTETPTIFSDDPPLPLPIGARTGVITTPSRGTPASEAETVLQPPGAPASQVPMTPMGTPGSEAATALVNPLSPQDPSATLLGNSSIDAGPNPFAPPPGSPLGGLAAPPPAAPPAKPPARAARPYEVSVDELNPFAAVPLGQPTEAAAPDPGDSGARTVGFDSVPGAPGTPVLASTAASPEDEETLPPGSPEALAAALAAEGAPPPKGEKKDDKKKRPTRIAPTPAPPKQGGGRLVLVIVALFVLLGLAGAGAGGYWFFFLRGK